MSKSMRGSIDSQIRAQQFKKFIASSNEEKKEFLKEKGIILDGLYVGRYNKATKRIGIEYLTNPFCNKAIEAVPGKSGLYSEEYPLVIKLHVNQGLKQPKPEDIFIAEMIGGCLETAKAKQLSGIIKQSKEHEKKVAILETEIWKSKAEIQKLKDIAEQDNETNKIKRDYADLSRRYKGVCESIQSIKEDNYGLSCEVNKRQRTIIQLERDLQLEKDVKYSYLQEITQLKERIKSIEEWYRRIVFLERQYGFEGFVHYTAYENLKSIMSTGYIVSREDAEKNNLRWIDVAEESVLQDTPAAVKDKVRLLYGFNTPISYRFEERAKSRNTEMVAIVIDPIIFVEHKLWFYEKSAARSSYGKPYTSVWDLKYFKWNEIFERGWYTPDKEYKKKYRDAEVVLCGRLSIDYISKVYFRSEMFLNKAIQEIGQDSRFVLGTISNKNGQFSPGI